MGAPPVFVINNASVRGPYNTSQSRTTETIILPVVEWNFGIAYK